jgi:perosamine synthetase
MEKKAFIPVAEPVFEGRELEYLSECINSGWISSLGKYVTEFEQGFAGYIGCQYGVAVHTGTAALHLALVALGVGPGDEVVIPDLTFAATANAVLYTGAKPVLVDVEADTWNMDPRQLEKAITENTKAVIAVHLYGHPCDMERILDICDRHEIVLVEDAAQAHGAEYKGKKVGSFGKVGCFSFFANKLITTGEGGICVTDDAELTHRIEHLRDHGMSPKKRYWHEAVGYNYRMTNLQAAVGVAQLERIEWLVERKRIVADLYRTHLVGNGNLILPTEKDYAKNIFWMFTICLKEACKVSRDELMKLLKAEGVDARPVFFPLHVMPPYREEKTYPNSEKISKAGLSLPSSAALTEQDVDRICLLIARFVT